MSNNLSFSGGQPIHGKKARTRIPRRRRNQDNGPYATDKGERILGLSKEYTAWDVYNNEATKLDRELVTVWENTLNTLLVPAGLFAGVLTAFIIESKQSLESDSMDAILDVMIFYVNNIANGTHKPYTPTEFQARELDIRINCLFFASLSASLVVALASVVGLQWVGEYDAGVTLRGVPPEQRARSRHFRFAGMDRWKMGGIITVLPLLLYASVMLFFAGISLWMWDLNSKVGAVVAGAATVAILFYGGSTLLGVFYVDTPFQTPFTRWIYSISHWPFSVLYRIIGPKREPWMRHIGQKLDASGFISWLEKKHANYTIASKREDREVEAKDGLGRDALVWLADHLNISQDSYQRLLLLVGGLLDLKYNQLPSFGPTEASWYSIFDMLGWNYLATPRTENRTPEDTEEDMHEMRILLQCYSVPGVKELTDPAKHMDYITDPKRRDYWSQYCGTADEDTWHPSDGPNRLFLLLRDIPMTSNPSDQEIEIAIRLFHWRNQSSKPPQAWDDVFYRVGLLPPESIFFSSCVVTFAQFCQLTGDVVWVDEHTETYTATIRKVIQMATSHSDLPRDTTILMIQAYESLLIEHRKKESTVSVLTNPLFYGKIIEQRSTAELTTHGLIILLLSRQINSSPSTEWAQRVEEVISLLWLRPSHPSLRNWNHLMAHSKRIMPLDPLLVMDWIKGADRIPHILEILQHLATAQANDAGIGPLWRATASNKYNDPHFLEALQTFDNLMGGNCMPVDHRRMIDWVCQDLEMAQAPDFKDYFTSERMEYFAQLRDPCLQTLADFTSGSDVIRPVVDSSTYYDEWRSSWDQIEQHLLRMYPDSYSPVILRLQAKLWPMYSLQRNAYLNSMTDSATLLHLRRLFQYPIHCSRCLDGPGHLLFHLLDAVESRRLGRELIPFIQAPSNGRIMEVAPIIFCLWYANADLRLLLRGLLGDGPCLREFEEMFDSIKSSEYQLLAFIWNVSTSFEDKKVFTEDLAAILAGVRRALQLPPQPESISLLGPLFLSISNLLGRVQTEEDRSLNERRMVSEAVDTTVNLLRSRAVHRAILGGRNNLILSCTRATNINVQLATGWLAPYEE